MKDLKKTIYMKKTIYIYIYIYIYILSVDDNMYAPLPGFEHSGEGINGCDSRNAKLF